MEKSDSQTISPELSATSDKHIKKRRDFAIPFIMTSFLSLPSLLILVFAKLNIGYSALEVQPFFVLVQVFLWLLVPIATISGLLFLWRGKGVLMRASAASLLLVVVASFVFINLPGPQ